MFALSIRQLYAELILRGIKTIEYRSRATRIVGERFWIYASKRSVVSRPLSVVKTNAIWSEDLAVAKDVPPWMGELAMALKLFHGQWPVGVIVGSAVIEKVTRGPWAYHWHLTQVERADKLRKPTGHPQPVWFNPF